MRLKDDAAAGPAPGTGERGFRELLSDLADRGEGAGSGTTAEMGAPKEARFDGLPSISALKRGIFQAGSLMGNEEGLPANEDTATATGSLQPAPLSAAAAVPFISFPGPVAVYAAGGENGAPAPDLSPNSVIQSASEVALALSLSRIFGLESDNEVSWGQFLPPAFGMASDGKDAATHGAAAPAGLESNGESFANTVPVGSVSAGVDVRQLAVSLTPMITSPADPTRAAEEPESPQIKVSVVGQEMHFAPVQTSSRALDLLAAEALRVSGQQIGPHAGERVGPEDRDGDARSPSAVLSLGAEEQRAALAAATLGAKGGHGDQGHDSKGLLPPSSGGQDNADAALPVSDPGDGIALSASQASPALQVASRIAAEIEGATFGGSALEAGNDASSRSAAGPLKVLHIELEPASLGKVTVRIELKDNVLSLHLEASRRETAIAIEKDQGTLSSALKSAGYLVDGITAEASGSSRPAAQPASADAQSSLSSPNQSQSGLAHSDHRGGGDRSQAVPEIGSVPAAAVKESGERSAPSASGAIYV
jgi:hypothetical protein